jgi:hypothetical protein
MTEFCSLKYTTRNFTRCERKEKEVKGGLRTFRSEEVCNFTACHYFCAQIEEYPMNGAFSTFGGEEK